MRGQSLGLWARWSWRDLRRRRLLVTALGLVIALGTGVYAGLGGTSAWRIRSNDLSYASLRMHDLRVQLPAGAYVPDGTLRAAAAGIEDADAVGVAVERLVVPTVVDVSTSDEELLVPGEVVGMPAGDAPVDSLYLERGSGLRSDAGRAEAVLESKFAEAHGLPARGRLVLGAETQVTYAGTGYTPEYFQVRGRSGSLLGETGHAVVFMTLPAAQDATGHRGEVNDLVVRLAPGAETDRVRDQLAAAVAPVGGTVSTRADDPVRRALYEDARNDQRTWNVFAVLILLGAGFAAFNLVARLIDSQRREIGVGMALGLTPGVLALRPVLVGVQVALLGVLAGTGVGWLTGRAMRRVLSDLLPLPVGETPFQLGRFATAASLGLAIPLVASVLPITRALRMSPVQAIRGGAGGSTRVGGRLLRVATRAPLPGRTFWSLPLRNVLRSWPRTVLSALGVAAAMTSLVAILGLLDSFGATGAANAAEVGSSSPERLTVTLDTFHPAGSTLPRSVAEAPGVARAMPQLSVPVTLGAGDERVDSVLVVTDLANPIWTPTTVGQRGTAGIVLAEKAAADLGVAPGDTVDLRHPELGAAGLRMETTRVPVRAIHPSPLRTLTYLDSSQAGLLGLEGAANQVVVVPSGDVDDLRRHLFGLPGVTAIESASDFAEALDDSLDQFTGIVRVIEVATLLLALLIAFNFASISADERTREHATMYAFGLPPRRVLSMAVAENAVVGLLGALAGLAGGWLALGYVLSGFDRVTPEILVEPALSTATATTTLGLGVLVVALAPLLGIRRARRMDIPAALRVVE